jgi:tetrahydromethanopterin S-methyltransferase subunit G
MLLNMMLEPIPQVLAKEQALVASAARNRELNERLADLQQELENNSGELAILQLV